MIFTAIMLEVSTVTVMKNTKNKPRVISLGSNPPVLTRMPLDTMTRPKSIVAAPKIRAWRLLSTIKPSMETLPVTSAKTPHSAQSPPMIIKPAQHLPAAARGVAAFYIDRPIQPSARKTPSTHFAFIGFAEARRLIVPRRRKGWIIGWIEPVRKVVWAKAYFLTPEEGGRNRNVDLSDPRYQDIPQEYEVLADFGFGYTEEDFPILRAVHVALEGGPGYIELGVEQMVLVGLYCPAELVKPGASFELSEGPKVVARCMVHSVIEWCYPLSLFTGVRGRGFLRISA
jgi:hypothetical protein